MVAIKTEQREPSDWDDIPGIQFLDEEEGRLFFDRKAREELGISGDEFLRRWDAGEFQPVPDTVEGRKVGRMYMMFPFVGRTYS